MHCFETDVEEHIPFVLRNYFWEFPTLVVAYDSLSIMCLRSKYSEPEPLLPDQYSEIKNDKGLAVHYDSPFCLILLWSALWITYLMTFNH